LKIEKSPAAIVPSSPNNTATVISNRLRWCLAQKICIGRLSSCGPEYPYTEIRSYWMVKMRPFGTKKFHHIHSLPSGSYTHDKSSWLRYSISPCRNKKEHPPCSKNPRYQNFTLLPPLLLIVEIEESSSENKSQAQPLLRSGCGMEFDYSALDFVLQNFESSGSRTFPPPTSIINHQILEKLSSRKINFDANYNQPKILPLL